MQTEEEMRTQLLDLGLADAVFDPNDGRLVEGEQMTRLVRTLATLEEAIIALERRGISLKIHAERQDPPAAGCPIYHVYLDGREEWFTTRDELDDFVAAQEKEAGGKLNVDVGLPTTAPVPSPQPPTASADGDRRAAQPRSASSSCTKSARSTPRSPTSPSSASTSKRSSRKSAPAKKTPRYTLRRGENETGLEDLRGLPAAIRAAGEKGLQITRFKGLGEMNAEELRDTTLDPANRTLAANPHGRRRRRRRPLPRPHGRQGRTPPRIHPEARAGCAEFGCVMHYGIIAVQGRIAIARSIITRVSDLQRIMRCRPPMFRGRRVELG